MLVSRLRALPGVQVTLAIALLLLGFLIAAQVAAEGPRVQYTTQERTPLIEAALNLQRQQEGLKDQIVALRGQIGDLESQGPGAADSLRKLYANLEAARVAAGLVAVTGPGVAFRLEDGSAGLDSLVTARDVRTLVDELWLGGAEAIGINGERVVASTAVLDIGGSILVNSAYLAGPYTISAIGPPDLYDRLRGSASFVGFVQGRIDRAGIGLSVADHQTIDLPAFAGTVSLRFAQPEPSPGSAP